MLRRFLNLFSNMSRKARRSGKHEAARPSRKLKLFLEALDSRLVPTANSTAVVTGGTLFIVENVGGSADTIQQTSAFGGNYSITDSNGSFNFSGVTNISFNATQSGISVEFGNGVNTGYNTTGAVTVNGLNAGNGLTVLFDGFNVNGKVSILNTGSGSSTDFTDFGDRFGSLTVTGGSAVTGGNTFTTINDSYHNGSISGVFVDLEGTQVTNGATTINFGAGGGYFLTDYTLDLGNGSNDGASGAANVTFNGDVTVTDLRTRFTDTFQMWDANVSGNVSINVSSIGSDEVPVNFGNSGIGGIWITNYNIGKNLSITTNTSSAEGDVYVNNSNVSGSASFVQLGGEGYAEFDNSNLNGSLTVNQSTLYSYFEAYGSTLGGQANTIGGAISIKQAGVEGEVYVDDFSTIKSTISIVQAGAEGHYAEIANDSTISGNVSVNQGTAIVNGVDINADEINGSVAINQVSSSVEGYVAVENSTLGALTIAQDVTTTPAGSYAEAYVDGDTIKGAVSVTQAKGGYNYVEMIQTTTTGAVTINQSSTVADQNEVYIENGSTINGSLTISQAAGSSEGYVDVGAEGGANVSITGSVTITQLGSGGADTGKTVYLENATKIGGNVSIVQANSANDSIYIENDTINGKLVATSQNSGASNSVQIYNDSINGSVTINQSAIAITNSAEVDDDSSINGSVTITQSSATGLAFADVESDDINGSVTVSHSLAGGGYNTSVNIENDEITGNVSIAQAGGSNDSVYIYGATITGSVTINQSATLNVEDYVDIDGASQINGSVTITQNTAAEGYVDIDNGSLIKGTLSIKQSASEDNAAGINNGSQVTGNVSINQGVGFDYFTVTNGSLIVGNFSVVGNSSIGAEGYVDDSTLNKSVSVTEAVGYDDYLYIVNGSTIIGSLTVKFGSTDNYVDIEDSTIHGTTTMALGGGVVGTNEVDIEEYGSGAGVTLYGTVNVSMGDGVNYVYIGDAGGVDFVANASFSANASGYNTHNVSNTSGETPVFTNF